MTDAGKKGTDARTRNVCIEGRISAGKVSNIQKGIVSGSHVQQIRNQIGHTTSPPSKKQE